MQKGFVTLEDNDAETVRDLIRYFILDRCCEFDQAEVLAADRLSNGKVRSLIDRIGVSRQSIYGKSIN